MTFADSLKQRRLQDLFAWMEKMDRMSHTLHPRGLFRPGMCHTFLFGFYLIGIPRSPDLLPKRLLRRLKYFTNQL